MRAAGGAAIVGGRARVPDRHAYHPRRGPPSGLRRLSMWSTAPSRACRRRDPGRRWIRSDPLSAAFRDAVSARRRRSWTGRPPALTAMGAELRRCTAGAPAAVRREAAAAGLLRLGLRARPAACPRTSCEPLLDAAASLELLHVSALVHDDVMDSSDLRRGAPAAHRQFEALHAAAGWLGDPPPSAGRARSCSATCC